MTSILISITALAFFTGLLFLYGRSKKKEGNAEVYHELAEDERRAIVKNKVRSRRLKLDPALVKRLLSRSKRSN